MFKPTFFRATIFRATILAAVLALSGCQLFTSQSAPETDTVIRSWTSHQQMLQQLNRYQASGKFAYLTPKNKDSASFFWQQFNPDWYRLLLTTPFGGKIVELNTQAGAVQLTNDKNQLYTSHDPEELILRLTNMNIPLNSLRQLLIGLPGNATNLKFDQNNRLQSATLKQNGELWQIQYDSYYPNLTPPLPKNIQLKQGEQTIKLSISNWTLR